MIIMRGLKLLNIFFNEANLKDHQNNLQFEKTTD